MNSFPETTMTENRSSPKRKLVFQPSIFRCELLVARRVVIFRIGTDIYGLVMSHDLIDACIFLWILFVAFADFSGGFPC